jgi:5-methylcytosine-specific restriction endonuclease McrA
LIDHVEIRRRARALADGSFYEAMSLVVECSEIIRAIAPTRRRLWLAEVVSELYEKQEGCCALCGEPMSAGDHEVDHVIAFCWGGGNERANIQLAHPECNRKKCAAVEPADLVRYLEDRYMNLAPT